MTNRKRKKKLRPGSQMGWLNILVLVINGVECCHTTAPLRDELKDGDEGKPR